MNAEFSGIERRLDELSDRLARLQPLLIARQSFHIFSVACYVSEPLTQHVIRNTALIKCQPRNQ